VRIPEEDATQELADDLAEAFLAVAEKHGIATDE